MPCSSCAVKLVSFFKGPVECQWLLCERPEGSASRALTAVWLKVGVQLHPGLAAAPGLTGLKCGKRTHTYTYTQRKKKKKKTRGRSRRKIDRNSVARAITASLARNSQNKAMMMLRLSLVLRQRYPTHARFFDLAAKISLWQSGTQRLNVSAQASRAARTSAFELECSSAFKANPSDVNDTKSQILPRHGSPPFPLQRPPGRLHALQVHLDLDHIEKETNKIERGMVWHVVQDVDREEAGLEQWIPRSGASTFRGLLPSFQAPHLILPETSSEPNFSGSRSTHHTLSPGSRPG